MHAAIDHMGCQLVAEGNIIRLKLLHGAGVVTGHQAESGSRVVIAIMITASTA